jgi:hypothetical protein
VGSFDALLTLLPGEHLVIDWDQEDAHYLFCAVLARRRSRLVRFATNQRREATPPLPAE